MSKFWKDPQNIIAIGVTLISVCALIVSITQTRIMIRQSELMDIQARASVRPILGIGSHRAFDPETLELTEYRLVATNNGVGPASIDDVYLESQGKPIHYWGELFDSFNLPDSIPTYIDNIVLYGSVIQAGESVTILDLSNNIALGRATYERFDDLKLRVLYSSIYGDRFEGHNTDDGWSNVVLGQEEKSFGADSFKN